MEYFSHIIIIPSRYFHSDMLVNLTDIDLFKLKEQYKKIAVKFLIAFHANAYSGSPFNEADIALDTTMYEALHLINSIQKVQSYDQIEDFD